LASGSETGHLLQITEKVWEILRPFTKSQDLWQNKALTSICE